MMINCYFTYDTIKVNRFEQWLDVRKNDYGFGGAEYYILIEVNNKAYKACETISLNVKSLDEIKQQMLIAKENLIIELMSNVINDIPLPEIDEQMLSSLLV